MVGESVQDVINRFRARGPAEPEKPKLHEMAKLLPDRHPTPDFFVADILDWALKDDRHSMEHPIFSSQRKPTAGQNTTSTMATASRSNPVQTASPQYGIRTCLSIW